MNRRAMRPLGLFVGVTLACLSTLGADRKDLEEAPKHQPKAPFPDYGFQPPGDQYKGPFFHLSQDYPKALPRGLMPGFFDTKYMENGDGKQNWKSYLEAVRAYCLEGNADREWVVQKNPIRKWYHAPWLHYGSHGREAIHGLTVEATAQPQQLAPTQKDKFLSVAVGFFNETAGYTIGRTWDNHFNPDPRSAKFKPGAVICKILFTQATPDQVPYLENGIVWKAYVPISNSNTTRKVQDVHLIQMDVMIRDDRGPFGWVFGTYCYNGNLNRANKWENLVPVGLQWGNDPEINADKINPKPTETIINPALKQSVINPSAEELPPQHLGWNSRLNGPLDYAASSCMSCHSVAEYPAVAALNPDFATPATPHGSEEWMVWFRNLNCGEPFSTGTDSTDYCIQLSMGITNFHEWYAAQGGLIAPAVISRGLAASPAPRIPHPRFQRNIESPK